jgi:hypothetical protein
MKIHSKRTLTLVLLALLCVMLAVGGEDVQQEHQPALELSNADQEHQHAEEQQAAEQQVSGWYYRREEEEGRGPMWSRLPAAF